MSFGIGFGSVRSARRRGSSGYGLTVGASLPENWAVARASGGTRIDSAGDLQTTTNNVGRITYNRSTLALRGLLLEPGATNGLRNNSMQGAGSGSPGTLPTNWSVGGGTGLTRTIVGTGTTGGMEYIDIRFAGTTGGTFTTLLMEAAAIIAAASGQTWTGSAYIAIVGGSVTNLSSITLVTNILDSGGAVLTQQTQVLTLSATLTRLSVTGTIANGSAAYVRPLIGINYASGVAVDITLRIALPQLEQGTAASSIIRTTGSAGMRAAETLTISSLSVYGLVNGSTYPATITFDDDAILVANLTVSGGAVSIDGAGTKPVKSIAIPAAPL